MWSPLKRLSQAGLLMEGYRSAGSALVGRGQLRDGRGGVDPDVLPRDAPVAELEHVQHVDADAAPTWAGKEQDPGSLQGPGPNHAAPPKPPPHRHLPSLRVNWQHQTGRRRKGTAFEGREVGDVLSDFVVTDSARREVLAPPD